jgi:signal transduction histidine kinase
MKGELARGTRLPLVLVLASLSLAIVVPRFSQRRIADLREEINNLADPARLRTTEIQLALAHEGSARRGYLLTGDQELATQFNAASARLRTAESQLLDYTRRLDASGSSKLTPLALRIEAMDHALDSLVADVDAHRASDATFEQQRQLFLQVEQSADSLGAAIDSAAGARRSEIALIESRNALLTGALLLLGFGAALLVGHLGSRFRTLALDREHLLISERAARQLAEHREAELERVTESRGRLLRGFTHDVKNPLGAADGYLALLEEGVLGDLAAPQRTAVGRIRRSIRHALQLTRQLLDVARAEAGELEISREETDIGALVQELTEDFRAQAEAKRLVLSLELSPELPRLETDPTRVRQVVGNLVSNAVKYTPAGGHVTVRAAVCSTPESRMERQLVIAVADDGGGISAEHLPVLFTEFTRLDPSAAEGAGIGLAISQRIARALGGEITVDSDVGKGATFELHLPTSSLSRRL